jgi:mono/diheme cytochrome c family protein
MKKITHMLMAVATMALVSTPALASDDAPDGAKLFNKKCKMCHAIDKKKMGPAVNAMNSDAEALRSAITDGKKRMPKFGHKFSSDEIDALVVFIQAKSI